MRLLFYSHDGQGLGHVRRNLAIAAAATQADPRVSVLLVSSTDHVDSLVVPPRVDILKLPGVRKVDDTSYQARRLSMSADDTWSLRASLITAATRSFGPDVLLADKHPYGVHGELREALGFLHAAGGRAVLGLRDILDDPETVRREWQRSGVLSSIARDYARVLVYGNRELLDPAAAYGMPPAAANLLRFCGYVVNSPPADGRVDLASAGGRPVVVATAGGGQDGYAMLSDFVRTSRTARWHPVVVSGTDASLDQQASLRRAVVAVGGTYHRFVRNLPAHFPHIAALVCMGGYNTTAEALAAAVPTVVVPRVVPRQEQLIRARAFADLGLVRMVPPDQLGGPVLGEAVRTALTDSRARIAAAVARHLDLDGARRAAAHLLQLSSVPAVTEPVDVAV